MSNTIFFPNILETATGTDVGGKKSLDVYVSGGTLSFTEAAIVADGGALPAFVKVIGGYDGAAVQVIKTDVNGELQVDVLSSALPVGASTETTLAAVSGKLPATLGQKTMANSLAVTMASDQSAIAIGPSKGRAFANAPVRNDYTSVNVTTAAFVQLVASTTSTINLIDVFDSSGQTLAFAVGAAASEVIQFYITPGGQGQVPLAIPAGSRVSIKAISATASVGEIDVNFYS